MYPFVTHTWNTVKGKCPHGCTYCYMKRFGEQKPVRFDADELKTDLGEGNFIFVGSSCDMFADGINPEWATAVIDHCNRFDNEYLFQTKNPKRFYGHLVDMKECLPAVSVTGTTIETNRVYPEMGKAPHPNERSEYMEKLSLSHTAMVTIEPIMDFDTEELAKLVLRCRPKWVNIGADSQGHNLPEPPKEKVLELIERLKEFTEVKVKDNLKRILK